MKRFLSSATIVLALAAQTGITPQPVPPAIAIFLKLQFLPESINKLQI